MDALRQLFSACTFLSTVNRPSSTTQVKLLIDVSNTPSLEDHSSEILTDEIPSLVRHFIAETTPTFRSAYSEHRTKTLGFCAIHIRHPAMDSDGDIVMGDVPFELTQPSLADYIMPFGKFQGEKLCEVPSWCLHWLPNISDPTPTFAAALTYAVAATSFTEMEVDWYPPPISAAPDDFHQYEKIKKEGKPKSPYTALWITKTNTMKYFYLSDEILRVMGVEKLPNEDPSETNLWKSPSYGSPQKKYAPSARYSLYHIWSLAQVYMTKGEADFVLRNYKNDVLRKDVQGSLRKQGAGFH